MAEHTHDGDGYHRRKLFWIGVIAQAAARYPRGGAWAIGLIGSAGALSIQFVLPAIGAIYDKAKLEAAGIRVESDLRNEKINYKVREHSLAKVPHLLVVGNREAEEGTVAVRTLGEKDQRVMSLDEAIAMLRSEATPPDLR